MQYTVIHNIHTYTKKESKHSEMGPVRQNPIQRTVRSGRECPIVVRYWADLQSVHGFRCYDNTAEHKMSASACTGSVLGSPVNAGFPINIIL